MKLPPPPIRLGVGGGERDGGDPWASGLPRKCGLVGGRGAGAEGQPAGELCGTDMPPLPQTDAFLPEGPAFLCFLPSSCSLHWESRATFPAFAPPPLGPPRAPFFGARSSGLASPRPLLPCHRHPSPSAGVSCQPFPETSRASSVGVGADRGGLGTSLGDGGWEGAAGLIRCDCHLFFSYPLSSVMQGQHIIYLVNCHSDLM